MTLNKNKSIKLIIDCLFIGLLVLLDQFTKQLAVNGLMNKPSFKIIENVFELNYLENRGAAFGMLQNKKIIFVIIAFIMLMFVLYMLYSIPKDKKYIALKICMILIGAGAIGNLIDRLKQDYVIDFFYFKLINFPIFNVADIYVSVACAVLVILILFVYKDEDLKFIRQKQKKD